MCLHITFTYEKAEKPFLHPYQTAAIFCEGEEIGYLGKVKYEIMKEEAMREDAYVSGDQHEGSGEMVWQGSQYLSRFQNSRRRSVTWRWLWTKTSPADR